MTISKYKKEYVIRTYECDKHENLRLLTLMNILQDSADCSADQLGVGYDFCVAHGLAWVAANYHIKVLRMPKIHEHITIQTWPSEEKKLGAIRDYEMFDEKGKLIIQASTQWVLINFETKRPQALRANLPMYDVLPEKADPYEFTKIPPVESPEFEKSFAVRFDDIDTNNHVNNAVYSLWLSESLPYEFRDNHEIAEMEITFKKEALIGENITILSALQGNKSLHSIVSANDGRELARAVLIWAQI